MGHVRDAYNRLYKFTQAGGDYIGPLREAYAPDPIAETNYEAAQAQFKADIRTMLDVCKATGSLRE